MDYDVKEEATLEMAGPILTPDTQQLLAQQVTKICAAFNRANRHPTAKEVSDRLASQYKQTLNPDCESPTPLFNDVQQAQITDAIETKNPFNPSQSYLEIVIGKAMQKHYRQSAHIDYTPSSPTEGWGALTP